MKHFDWSKFKKVDANRDHTVMHHPDGHIIHVAHKGLEKHVREALRQLPIQKMSQGGEVRPSTEPSPEPKPEPKPTPKGPVTPEVQAKFLKGFNGAFGMADGGVVPSAPPEEFEPGKDFSKAPLPGEPTASLAPASDTDLTPTSTTSTPRPTAYVPPGPDNRDIANAPVEAPAPVDAPGLMEAGLKGQMESDVKKGDTQLQAAEQTLNTLRDQQAADQKRLNDIQAYNDKIIQETANTDPSKLLVQRSLGGRLASAIGIMLGGGIVVGAVNKWLDQEVDQQRAQQGQRDTLFKLNEQRFGDAKVAADMTKLNLLSQFELQVKAAEAKGLSQSALPNYQKQLAEFTANKAKLLQDINMRQQQQQNLKSGGGVNNPEGADPTAVGAFIDTMIPEHLRGEAYKELGHLQAAQSGVKAVQDDFNAIGRLGALSSQIPFSKSKAEFESTKATLLSNVVKSLGSNPSDRDMKTVERMLPSWSDLASPQKEAILRTKSNLMTQFLRTKQEQTTPTPILNSRKIKLREQKNFRKGQM